jgi:ABC-type antimicrobial peptide transport system permease subunit
MMGRTKTGVDARQVQAELERVFQASALETYDAFVKGLPAGSPSLDIYSYRPDTPHLRVSSGSQGLTRSVEDASRLFFTLIAIFAFLLLLVCLNIANLLVARSAARQQEIGVRLAMGASRIRVIRQLLTESLLMASCESGNIFAE